jgi:hypothetical protein
MTDLSTAFDSIHTALETLLTPMITNNTINQIKLGGKQREKINPPSLGIIPLPMDTLQTSIGSGKRETWTYPIRLRGLYKELTTPQDGFSGALNIVSEARNLILAERQLGIPATVRKVDSTKIEVIPFPVGKKSSLYAADAYFNIYYIIDNE